MKVKHNKLKLSDRKRNNNPLKVEKQYHGFTISLGIAVTVGYENIYNI